MGSCSDSGRFQSRRSPRSSPGGLIGHSRREGLVGLVEGTSLPDDEDLIYRSLGEGLNIGIGKPVGLAAGVIAPNDDDRGLQGIHAIALGPDVIRAQEEGHVRGPLPYKLLHGTLVRIA